MVLHYKKLFFNLFDNDFNEFTPDDLDSICVVSFFGKSFWDSEGCKYDGFKTFKGQADLPCGTPQVYGLFDPEKRVIYLQLYGVLDVKEMVKTIQTLSTELNDKGYLSTWADLKIEYAKNLLLLFSISHIMVLSHPVATFDLSYMHLFRALENARRAIRSDISRAISSIHGLSKDWQEAGRPCSPRLLFHFLRSPHDVTDTQQFEHALEDQIYHFLKKNKIISNNSGNSLFAIPINQEFVFVETAFERRGSRLISSVHNLLQKLENPALGKLPLTFNQLSVEYELQESTVDHTFEKFLSAHILVALSKGLCDNVGRHVPPAVCALPTCYQFLQVARALIPLTSSEDSSGPCTEALRLCLDVDRKFSEGRCAKVLPIALAAYQESAPPHYPLSYHETRLAQALGVLAMHGRGALMDKYVAELESQCTAHWQNGRQMCETISLTGHPCINAIHKGGGEGAGGGELPDERKSESLEEKEHCSGLRYLSACNCGRKQGHRADPYTLKTANYEFYKSLATECGCDKLESYKIPVFQPSVKDFRAAQLLGRRESLALLRGNIPRSQLGGTQQEGFSLAFASGPSIQGSCDIVEPRLSCLRTQHPDILILTNQPGDSSKDRGLVRQASTTEYLPGMLHTDSPTGLLPQFASWSLVCVGASSVYSHNLGLSDQPGLLPGSSYLLPWDVTVRLENVWPSVSDTKRGGPQMRIRKSKGEQSEMVVKIFIGVEYECTRGHRFMTAAPDKVLKTGPSGQVRDTGHRVASSDMPLYFPCPCSKPIKPVVAQLMRLHVVTPKAPVRVTLNPRVQPAPNAPIFIACQDQPIPLSQSTYWVLRLPYVYMADRSPFVAPLEIPGAMYGRLLGGSYGITEIPPERS